MALEVQTGKSFDELLDEFFVQPLGLKNTMSSPGDDGNAVIPPGESSWGSDYNLNTP
jgi:CubicO group peptidase (beta-lactamase class C family)